MKAQLLLQQPFGSGEFFSTGRTDFKNQKERKQLQEFVSRNVIHTNFTFSIS
jgi:hypothetical protein